MNTPIQLTPADRQDLVRRTRLFGHLTDADLALLAESAGIQRLAAGERLFEAGDPGDTAFIVAAGELRGTLPNGTERIRFTAGDFFGEYALFTLNRRTLTVTAQGDVVLLALPHERLEQLLHRRPGIAYEMLRQAVHKIVDLEARLPGPPTDAAV